MHSLMNELSILSLSSCPLCCLKLYSILILFSPDPQKEISVSIQCAIHISKFIVALETFYLAPIF